MDTKALRQKILDLAIRGKLVPPAGRQAGKTLTTNPTPPIAGRKCWYTYVIECEDGSFYKGFTDDLVRRYNEHCRGIGAKHTKLHKPKQLFYWELHYSQEAAHNRELYLKSGSGREWFKENVVNNPEAWEPASVLLDRIRAEKERLIAEGKIKRSKKSKSPADKPHYENDLPQGWVWARVDDVADCALGKMLDKVKNEGTPYPYLRNQNVRWGDFDLNDIMKMRFKSQEKERFEVHSGDLIMCEGGEPGRCAIWNHPEVQMMYQKALHRIRPYKSVSVTYLYNVFQWLCGHSDFSSYFTGSTIKHLPADVLTKILIPVPPCAEQLRISAEIERWFAVIDEIEAGKVDLEQLIDRAKAKVLSLAIAGKLVGQDTSDEVAEAMLKRINPSWQPADTSHYENLPEGWTITTLGAVGRWMAGGTPSRHNKAYYGGSIPWLKIADLNDSEIQVFQESITEEAVLNSSAKKLPKESILLAMYGSIGKLGILKIDGATTNQAICACTEYIGLEQKFLFYLLMSLKPYFISQSGGGVQANISKDIIVKTVIPLPPLEEQKRIVTKIEELFGALDAIKAELAGR